MFVYQRVCEEYLYTSMLQCNSNVTEVWRKPRGRPCNSWVRTVTNDLAKSYTGLPEAREAAQERALWRMFTKHSATHS